MKSLREFNADLKEKSEKHLGYNLSAKPQRSQEWLKSRLGVITASKAIALYKDGRKKGTVSALWDTYQLELISEIVTGRAKDTPLTNAMEWGNTHEHEARELFAFENSLTVSELTFCYADNMRCGVSPDGVIEGLGLNEIKCPFNSSNHVAFLLDEAEIKAEYIAQMQFQMWVMKAKLNYYIDYDPRCESNQIKHVVIEADQEYFDKFEERTALFIKEMDAKLEKLGLEYGAQWNA